MSDNEGILGGPMLSAKHRLANQKKQLPEFLPQLDAVVLVSYF